MSPLTRPAAVVASRGDDLLPRLVEPVADLVLATDLPGLAEDRRRRAATFIASRCTGLPSVMKIGVALVAALFRLLIAVPGGRLVVGFLAAHPLPLVGEYPRLIRSLGYAFIWETWPETHPDGSAE